MKFSTPAIERAIEAFSTLPSIGRKSAARLVFHILKQEPEYAHFLSEAISLLRIDVKFCSSCFNYSESDICPICSSEKRDKHLICVIESPSDVNAIEKTNEYKGLYHVLHGKLSPLDGIGPEMLKIKELIPRLKDVEEVILALNPSVEGEVTSQYIAKMLRPLEIKITKIASGIPIGASLEFSDELTLVKALENRKDI